MKIIKEKITLNDLKKISLYIFYIFIILIAVGRAMQFHVRPMDNMDLSRHMKMMKLVKMSNYSLFEYVFSYGDALTSNISMKYCYGFNTIAYIVANYAKNYYIISWLFVFLDYSVISYIGIDWWKTNNCRTGIIGIYEILISFSLFPFIHAVSGLRTSFAACIMALAIYIYLYKNKSLIIFVLIAILSVSFHPAFITAIPFAILAKKFDRKKGLMISIIGCASVFIFVNIFIRSSNQFLYSIAYKYSQYTDESGYKGTRFCYYGVIVICILALVRYFSFFMSQTSSDVSRNSKNNSNTMMYDFIAYYAIFILSNVGKYEMVLRPAYLLGAMAPIFTGMMFRVHGSNRIQREIFDIVLLFILLLIIIYVSFMYLIWHNKYF